MEKLLSLLMIQKTILQLLCHLNFYFYKYIDILYQRGFLYTDRRLKE
ncbi:hypothetical protein HpVa147_24440 [Helicobacter pylori]